MNNFKKIFLHLMLTILLYSMNSSLYSENQYVNKSSLEKIKNEKVASLEINAHSLLEKYCSDCHDDDISEGGLDLLKELKNSKFDGSLIFENIITGKMPLKKEKRQLTSSERELILEWLASGQKIPEVKKFRRLSRHEFLYSINDLLKTDLDLRYKLPEDRSTYKYDTNNNIELSNNHLKNYFKVTDELLKYALPDKGFPLEKTWNLRVKLPIFPSYAMHIKKYKQGMLFACMRSNNGKVYPYFYDGFKAPQSGLYRISLNAAKVGEFKEDIALTLYAGKYFYTDANDQPQRILSILSLNDPNSKTYSIQVFMNKGEELSIHAYLDRTLRNHVGKAAPPEEGAYIKEVKVQGPLYAKIPKVYDTLFRELPVTETIKDNMRILKVNSTLSNDLVNVLRTFANRAFPSELTDAELKPFIDLGLKSIESNNNFTLAVRTVVKAMLCSSRFLQVPTGKENRNISVRLAHGLWLSIPDEYKSFKTHREIANEIDRMLSDPKSKRMVESFMNQWLNLKAFSKITPSIKIYPEYSDIINHYLPIETGLFLQYAINRNLTVNTLIDSNFTFLNQRIAEHYQIPKIYGMEMRLHKLPNDSERGGLLTMGSILKVTADGHHTSPILRGAWISKNIVGTPLSPPPANIEVVEPDLSKSVTLKDQLAAHRKNKSCNSCHKDIDPYGFALEGFDPTGKQRTKYRIDTYNKNTTFHWRKEGFFKETMDVDTSSDIHSEKFDDIRGLKKILTSNHKNIAYNFAKNFFEYFNGYTPTQEERLAIYKMIPESAEDSRLKDLIKKIIIFSVLGDKSEI